MTDDQNDTTAEREWCDNCGSLLIICGGCEEGPPCDCGHDEADHLHLFTSNRCTQCDCEGYQP